MVIDYNFALASAGANYQFSISSQKFALSKTAGNNLRAGRTVACFLFLQMTESLDDYFRQKTFWSLNNFLGWGSLALAAMILPLVTSNNFSRRFLGGNWKKLQRLVYPAFIFIGMHIYFLKDDWVAGFLPIIVWLVLWIWAGVKNKKAGRSFC